MINRSSLKAALTKKAACLSPQELERILENPSQKHPHLDSCPRCQAELALLKEFKSDLQLPDEGAAVAWISSHLDRRLDQIKSPNGTAKRSVSQEPASWMARLFGGRNIRWLIPVAALVLIAAASVVLLRSAKQPELHADLGSGPAVYRSQEVQILAPVGETPRPPKELQWKAFPNAAKYQVQMMEVDHSLMWSGETNDIILTIPTTTQNKMFPGKPVLWQVTALDAEGRTLAVSQLQRFSVTKKN